MLPGPSRLRAAWETRLHFSTATQRPPLRPQAGQNSSTPCAAAHQDESGTTPQPTLGRQSASASLAANTEKRKERQAGSRVHGIAGGQRGIRGCPSGRGSRAHAHVKAS
eukprot:scaffold3791_cov390-Prasinococcus_capsulatus_cf.AAC.4